MIEANQYEDADQTVDAFSKQILMHSKQSGDSFHGGILLNDTDKGNRIIVYVLSNQTGDYNFNLINALSLEGILQMFQPNLTLNLYMRPFPINHLYMQEQIPPVPFAPLFFFNGIFTSWGMSNSRILFRDKI